MTLTAPTAGNRPTYVAAGIRGLPSLQFDGVNDGLVASASTALDIERTQALTIFTIAKSPGTYSDDAPIVSKGSGIDLGWYLSFNFTSVFRFAEANSSSNRMIADATFSFAGVQDTIITTYDGGSLVAGVAVRNNGAGLSVAAPVNNSNASIKNSSKFAIGYNGVHAAFAGLWSETWIWSRVLTVSEIARLELYAGKAT